MKLCDLHTHSVYSDGTYTPAQLLAAAEEQNLSALVLSDHNTADGLPDFLKVAEGSSVEAIPATEFSVGYNGTELHLLGLFLPVDSFPKITALMQEYHRRKEQSNIDLVAALNRAGYAIDYESIRSATPNQRCNRAHIAAELTKKGYTDSIKQAFSALLSPKAGFYKEPQFFTLWEMLDFIRQIGGVPVLAHPFLNLKADALAQLLPQAKARGLAGMECLYSLYSEETTRLSFDLARQFSLLPSGGSDFHGDNKPDIRIGVGKGNLAIPYDWVTALRNA